MNKLSQGCERHILGCVEWEQISKRWFQTYQEWSYSYEENQLLTNITMFEIETLSEIKDITYFTLCSLK